MSQLVRRLQRIAPVLYAHLQLRRCSLGFSVGTFGRVVVEATGTIRVGDRTTLCGGLVPTALVAHRDGTLEIGAECMINAGSRFEAHQHVKIGNRCLIASSVTLIDRDSERRGAIVIEDNVWLAHGVVVAPGVRIGRNSVVSAGSVVLTDVPADSLAVGDPARAMPLTLVAGQH